MKWTKNFPKSNGYFNYFSDEWNFKTAELITEMFCNGTESAQSVWRLGYGLGNWWNMVWFSEEERYSVFFNAPVKTGAPPISYSEGIRGFFPGGKEVNLTTHLSLQLSLRMHGAILPFSCMPLSMVLKKV